ncbi:MAG: MFS transporter, partial [Actinomycetota bacterium]|nr:MFS transporter [Actinomycetota bacterium]
GPLIGGAATTYLSWRWVFFSESIIVAVILLLSRRIADAPVESKKPLDFIGTLLSVAGLGLAVYGVLRTSEWGWINPKADGPSIAGLSPSFWLILVGSMIVWLFFQWEHRVLAAGREPLVRADIFASRQLNGGLIMFFFQFLLQSGVFFVIPLYLSVVLELSAIDTGIRLMPLSISLLLAAVAIPKLWPMVSPRRVVRIGVTLMLLGILALLAGIDINSTAAVVALPLTLLGLGMGSLASQLGSVTVSGVSDERSGEVGGLQNTATNLGASLGTALAGSILIAVLTGSLIAGIQSNEQVPESVQQQAGVELASGVPFLSDTQLEAAMLEAGASPEVTDAVVMENQAARVQGLDAGVGVLAILAMASLV